MTSYKARPGFLKLRGQAWSVFICAICECLFLTVSCSTYRENGSEVFFLCNASIGAKGRWFLSEIKCWAGSGNELVSID